MDPNLFVSTCGLLGGLLLAVISAVEFSGILK